MSRESCALSFYSLQSIALLSSPIILSRIWQLISPPFFGSASPCQWQTHTRVPRQLWKKNLTTRNLSCARGNVEIDPSDLASLSDACESSLRTRDMSEKYLRHRQSFNLSHFLASNLRLYFDCDFGFGFASVHWRQVHRSYDFPLTEVCATCVCLSVCVSCLPGTCSLQRNHFYNWHAASQKKLPDRKKKTQQKVTENRGKEREQKESL